MERCRKPVVVALHNGVVGAGVESHSDSGERAQLYDKVWYDFIWYGIDHRAHITPSHAAREPNKDQIRLN